MKKKNRVADMIVALMIIVTLFSVSTLTIFAEEIKYSQKEIDLYFKDMYAGDTTVAGSQPIDSPNIVYPETVKITQYMTGTNRPYYFVLAKTIAFAADDEYTFDNLVIYATSSVPDVKAYGCSEYPGDADIENYTELTVTKTASNLASYSTFGSMKDNEWTVSQIPDDTKCVMIASTGTSWDSAYTRIKLNEKKPKPIVPTEPEIPEQPLELDVNSVEFKPYYYYKPDKVNCVDQNMVDTYLLPEVSYSGITPWGEGENAWYPWQTKTVIMRAQDNYYFKDFTVDASYERPVEIYTASVYDGDDTEWKKAEVVDVGRILSLSTDKAWYAHKWQAQKLPNGSKYVKILRNPESLGQTLNFAWCIEDMFFTEANCYDNCRFAQEIEKTSDSLCNITSDFESVSSSLNGKSIVKMIMVYDSSDNLVYIGSTDSEVVDNKSETTFTGVPYSDDYYMQSIILDLNDGFSFPAIPQTESFSQ